MLDLFPKVGKTTRTVSWFRRESRSYTPCVEYAREDRPARRTWPFLSILKTVPPLADRTLSFSSICATITLLRSPNASSPHLVSGSLLLPPFTQRSARNSVEKNVNRLPQLIPRRRIGLCRFPRFVSKSWQDDAHGQLVSSRES